MDPLSLTMTAITLVQLAGSVALKLKKYTKEASERTSDVERLVGELNSLAEILQGLVEMGKASPSEMHEAMSVLSGKSGPFDIIQQDLTTIDRKLISHDQGWRAIKDKLIWPFTKPEVEELLVRLERQKATIMLALNSSQTELLIRLKQSTDKVSLYFDLSQARDEVVERECISEWLAAPDPGETLNLLTKQRQPGTGSWLLENTSYNKWRSGETPNLWLTGIPGCGKSLLTALVINTLLTASRKEDDLTVLYFFFDFRSPDTQQSDKMLRSFLDQLSRSRPKAVSPLSRLYNHRQQTLIGRRAFLDCLKSMTEHGRRYHIVIDAIDECRDRDELFDILREVSEDFPKGWQVFASSRTERDIQDHMESLGTKAFPLQGPHLQSDIKSLIEARLRDDPKLRKWPDEVKNEITDTLVKGSGNMFRWTACQLDALRKAIRLPMLRKMLNTLPQSLDETYLRLLESIDDEFFEDASRLLKLLAVCMSDLTVNEAAEFLAIDMESDEFEPLNRLPEPLELLDLCGPMISITAAAEDDGDNPDQDLDTDSAQQTTASQINARRLRLAHYSVKEFLVSDRLRGHTAERYAFKITDGHYLAARLSLAYLSQLHRAGRYDLQGDADYPALSYASQRGLYHASHAAAVDEAYDELLYQLLDDKGGMYENFRKYISSAGNEVVVPGIYFACRYGLARVLSKMIQAGADVNMFTGSNILTLLQAVVDGSDSLECVNILLEAGANVNAASKTPGGYALTMAAAHGNIPIIQRLIEAGAKLENKTPLMTALAVAPNKAVAKALIDAGADVHAKTDARGDALISSILYGHDDVSQCLLDHGADPNAASNHYTALGLSAYLGRLSTVKALLKKGADIHQAIETAGTALLQCLLRRDLAEDCLQYLLENGADPLFISSDNPWGSIIGAAASAGRKDAVQMLVARGADLFCVGAQGKSLLHFAGHCSRVLDGSLTGPKCSYAELIQYLVGSGLSITATDASGHNGILNACVGSSPTAVRKVIELGGDVNSIDPQGWTCLHWAAKSGTLETVKLLIEAGADASVVASTGGQAWEVAAYCGYDEVALFLNPELKPDAEELRAKRYTGYVSQIACEICREPDPRGQYFRCSTCTSRKVYCFRCVLDMRIEDSNPDHEAVPVSDNADYLLL